MKSMKGAATVRLPLFQSYKQQDPHFVNRPALPPRPAQLIPFKPRSPPRQLFSDRN
jgi:hypothetical protein